jgi:hypothetical protein
MTLEGITSVLRVPDQLCYFGYFFVVALIVTFFVPVEASQRRKGRTIMCPPSLASRLLVMVHTCNHLLDYLPFICHHPHGFSPVGIVSVPVSC